MGMYHGHCVMHHNASPTNISQPEPKLVLVRDKNVSFTTIGFAMSFS